jgi:hypothetical protein
MKYITEDDLRTIYKVTPFTSYELETGTRLTPGARQFLQDRHIAVFSEDGTAMHEGDGIVVGQYRNGHSNGNGTPDLLNKKRLEASIQSTNALFLETASGLLDKDPVMAQQVLELGNCFNDIRQMTDEGRSFPALACTPCSGINEDNFSSELGPCFEMTSFHIQMAKGKEMLLLHRLRCELYEFLVVLMETHCTNKEIPVRVNQIINRLHQMICIAFGGDGCQRK